jgi:hypothetical protein
VRDAILESLVFAPVIALTPVPIIAVILLLGTPHARTNAMSFVVAWAFGLLAIGTVVLLASRGADTGGSEGPRPLLGAGKLALAALALAIAVQQWRRRGRAREVPAWMRRLDGFRARSSAVLALMLSAGNPKNIVAAVGATAAIAAADIEPGGQAVALAIFVAVATLGVLVPVCVYFVFHERSARALAALRAWLVAHSATLVSVLMFLIAGKLLHDGVADL